MLLKIKNKSKVSKKGITLIEAIISVALLSILLVPISGIVINSFKTSKSAEIKQNAAYVGQKLLEELKSYDNITIKDFQGNNKKGFYLLNGQEVALNADGTFTGEYNSNEFGGKFKVNIVFVKNDNFIYEKENESDFELSISGTNAYLLTTKNNNSRHINNTIRLVIDMNGTIELFSKEKDHFNKLETLEAENNKDNNILINLEDNFKKDNFILEIENKSNKLTTIYLNGPLENRDIEIKTIFGKVTSKYYDTNKKVGNLYNIDVKVSTNEEALFTGKTSNNIIFK